MKSSALRHVLRMACFQLALLVVVPLSANAHSVYVPVTGSHGLYRVFLYNESSISNPVSIHDGYMQYGCSCNRFEFANMASGHAYWAKAVRMQDGRTIVGGGSVYMYWWSYSITLPTISFPWDLGQNAMRSDSPPTVRATGETSPTEQHPVSTHSTWGAIKIHYR